MLLAADYPFLDVLWTMMVFFVWITWFWMLIAVFRDIFGRADKSGLAKVAWLILVIVLPFLGVFVYLIANTRQMNERNAARARAQQQQFDDYVQSIATTGGPAAEIDQAKQLLDRGAISRSEFDAIKAKALA